MDYKLPSPDAAHPTLVHLNADTSWLLTIPLAPPSAQSPAQSPPARKSHFTILIDPWLRGPQHDYYRWFSTQWHAVPSCVESIAGLGDGVVNAVLVSHEFGDHCHEVTLREVGREVPVYATEKAAQLIRGYNHFQNVYTIPGLPGAIDSTTAIPQLSGLPDGICITRVVSSARDLLYYHSAICISYTLPTPHPSDPGAPAASAPGAECILYTPHGVPSTALPLPSALPVRALLHGLHEVHNPPWLGGALNLGAPNGVRAVRRTGARWWVGTHDEVKRGAGVVSWVMRRRVWAVGEAVREVGKEEGPEGGEGEGMKHVVLGSGESLVLT